MKSVLEEIRLEQSRTTDSSALPQHGRRRQIKWEVAVGQVLSRILSKKFLTYKNENLFDLGQLIASSWRILSSIN